MVVPAAAVVVYIVMHVIFSVVPNEIVEEGGEWCEMAVGTQILRRPASRYFLGGG